MMNKFLLGLLAVMSVSHSSFAKPLVFCKTNQNIVASRLAGSWTLDHSLSTKLDSNFSLHAASVKMSEEDSVLHLFNVLGDLGFCAYQAGAMTLHWQSRVDSQIRVVESPYVLIERYGNPALVYDERGYNGIGPIKDMHQNFLMLAKGRNPENDILYWGGDFNNQPLIAFIRE